MLRGVLEEEEINEQALRHVRATLTILYHARLEVVSVQGESLILKRGSAIVVRTIVSASCVPVHVRFPHEMNLESPASYGRVDGEAHRPANHFASIENSRLAFEVDCDLRDAHCGNAELLLLRASSYVCAITTAAAHAFCLSEESTTILLE